MKNAWLPLCIFVGFLCGLFMPDPVTALLTCVLSNIIIISIWFKLFGSE